ncbi:MAG: MarR family winged helix-turn-helix transcriptional regulator [Nocardioidaceae bacterium]
MSETRWLTTDQQRAWRGYLAMQAQLNARLSREMAADSELSLPDFAVLVHLTDVPEGRVRAFELGRALQWEKSRVSHHVARMERRGLVAREGCNEDGRGAFVVLTPTGRHAIESAAPPHVDVVRRLVFDSLTDDQVAAMTAISESVLARLTQTDEAPADPAP